MLKGICKKARTMYRMGRADKIAESNDALRNEKKDLVKENQASDKAQRKLESKIIKEEKKNKEDLDKMRKEKVDADKKHQEEKEKIEQEKRKLEKEAAAQRGPDEYIAFGSGAGAVAGAGTGGALGAAGTVFVVGVVSGFGSCWTSTVVGSAVAVGILGASIGAPIAGRAGYKISRKIGIWKHKDDDSKEDTMSESSEEAEDGVKNPYVKR